ncbi:hypothetical protein AAG570_008645 [Ranatra chinensis]|uniref:Uncharacterized protein n=1 Tax=Ranatra chinensis TaxID=642074 RepID=A0ABD0Z274_9HEMI
MFQKNKTQETTEIGLSTWEPISPFEDQPSTTTESSALIPFVGTTVLVAEPATEIAPKEDPDPPARGDQPHENPEVEGGNEVDNSSYSTTEEPPESGIEGNVANSDMNNGPPTGLATTPTPMSKPEGGLSPHEERLRKLKFHLESKGCSDLAIQKILEKHGGANVHILRARTQREEEDEHPNGVKGKRRGSGMRRGKGNNGGHHDDEDNEDDDVNNNDDKEGKRKRERKRKGMKGEHHDDEHEDENEYEYEDGRKRKRERKGKGNKGVHDDHDDHDDEHEDENEDDNEGKRKRNRNGNGHGRNSTRTGRPKRSPVYKRSLPSEESEESMSECSYSLVSYSDSFSYSYSDSYSDSFSASKMHVFKRDVNESGPDGNESEPNGDSAGDDDASDQGGNSEGDDESGNGNENSDGHGGDQSGQPADVDDSIAANDSEE